MTTQRVEDVLSPGMVQKLKEFFAINSMESLEEMMKTGGFENEQELMDVAGYFGQTFLKNAVEDGEEEVDLALLVVGSFMFGAFLNEKKNQARLETP